MQSNSPGAFFLSLTLHGLLIALIIFFTYVVKEQIVDTPKILELVAGPGDNYAATEAPAPSPTTDAIMFELPDQPIPEIIPTPAPVEPEPVIEPVIKKAPSKEVPKIVLQPLPKPIEKAPAKVEPPKPKPAMSIEEFRKKNPQQKSPSQNPPKAKSISVRTIDSNSFANVASKSTAGAGGKAMTRDEGRLLDSYIALLLQRLRAAHEKPPGLSDLLQVRVRFNIAANGTLSSVTIVTSSGSADFDQSVLRAFAKVRSIGPTPNGKSDVWTVAFRVREE